MIFLLLAVAALAAGGILWFVLDQRYARQLGEAKKTWRQQLDQELQARFDEQRRSLDTEASRLRSHEESLRAECAELAAQRDSQAEREAAIERTRIEIEEQQNTLAAAHQAELARLSGLSPEGAREQVLKNTQSQLQAELSAQARTLEAELRQKQAELAQEILTRAIQRTAVSHAREQMAIAVPLPDAGWRGRVIGKEGRTVQALQAATGADFSLDEESPAVWVSSFDPLRRELARRTLLALIESNRLHPARIDAEAQRQQAQLEAELPGLGEQAAARAGVHGLHDEVLTTLGRLHYRRSFGQDVLQHSVEVSLLAGQLATQLGADVEIARRGGLLHDLGKALASPESSESHTALGVALARRCGEKPEVLHVIAAHHFEEEPHSVEAMLVQVADTLSAARPGARSDQLAKHVQRLGQCEKIALGFAGVTRAWVLRAGKEVRVLVDPDTVPEERIRPLAGEIAQAIGQALQGAGQVKVSVIREIQASDYAR
ncbi:MAG: Rnase Y domain-containing protein [Candidatus Sericytochromatia bacterium]